MIPNIHCNALFAHCFDGLALPISQASLGPSGPLGLFPTCRLVHCVSHIDSENPIPYCLDHGLVGEAREEQRIKASVPVLELWVIATNVRYLKQAPQAGIRCSPTHADRGLPNQKGCYSADVSRLRLKEKKP
ncbi:hypothetical protein VTK56DRAFT_10212 [Thermocarpiscus australiensis]